MVSKKTIKKIQKVRKLLVQTTDNKTLTGWCAVGAYILFLLLNKKHKPYFCVNKHHCFIEINGKYYDITASQFGDKAIVIVGHGTKKWYYENSIKTRSTVKIKKLLKDWKSPTPYKHKKTLTNIILDVGRP
jgi:hypothetical protein